MSAWTIYWFTRIDGFLGICITGVIISILALVAYLIFFIFATVEEEPDILVRLKPLRNISSIVLIACSLLLLFIPSSKEFAAIYLIPKVVNNEQVQQIPSKGLDLLNAKLDQWLDDLRKDKEKK